MSERICSNCGSACGIDSRMGSVNHYLVCECASAKNSHWINDGRGGYTIHLNDARPVPIDEYLKMKNPKIKQGSEWHREWDNWGRDDD